MKKILSYVILLSLSSMIRSGYATTGEKSIFASSISWHNKSASKKLLSTIHAWPKTTINNVFAYFKRDQQILSSPHPDHNKSHVNFVNFTWGPVDNPYSRFQRPSRVFVFVGDTPIRNNYYIAHVIQNADNQQYYVFESGSRTLITLDYWIHTIESQLPVHEKIKINICNHYATLPTDICGKSTYESEAHYVHDDYIPDPGTLPYHGMIHTAKRPPEQHWEHFISNSSHRHSSIEDTSVDWNDVNKRDKLLKKVVAWPNYQLIGSIFKYIRDKRYYTDDKDAGFLRRITWLFPDDGCWSRAAAVIKDYFGSIDNPVSKYHRPSKIFAFGNLCVNTPNAIDGFVTWWFHVAPIIRDKETNQLYVLDAAVQPNIPLKVEQWIEKITETSGKCAKYPSDRQPRISICNGYGLWPHENCIHTSDETESYATLEQMLYMKYETSQQIDLGRDPNRVLGDSPPWNDSK